MRELKWSLWQLRYFFVLIAGIMAVLLYLVSEEKDGINLLGTAYRTMFVALQMVFGILQTERFSVVLRKAASHKFYRSMSHAWEKEQRRFLWMDGFILGCLAVLFVVGVLFRSELTGGVVPILPVLVFLLYMVFSRSVAAVPYIGWIIGIVFWWLLLLLPVETVPIGVGIGGVVVFAAVQAALYRMIKSLWHTEE